MSRVIPVIPMIPMIPMMPMMPMMRDQRASAAPRRAPVPDAGTAAARPGGELPALGSVAELLRWRPAGAALAAWRDVLDRSAPWRWTLRGPTLDDTGIAVDDASAFEFPDDEPGRAAPRLPAGPELEIATRRLRTVIAALRRASPQVLAFVTTFIEVLALRSAPPPAPFHASTFPGFAGLVRFTNAHLAGIDTPALVEALVREAIHGILHVHEQLDGPFVRPTHARCKIMSPWTGATIGLAAYVHGCAVWYGIHHLWSLQRFASGEIGERAEALRRRAHAGFDHRPVSIRLAPFAHLLAPRVRHLLWELEERMLSSNDAR